MQPDNPNSDSCHCICVVARSPHHGYAVRERSRGHFSIVELYFEGTRVSFCCFIPYAVNALLIP